jgi:hypothetical protein
MGNASTCCEAQAPNNKTDIVTQNLANEEQVTTGPMSPPSGISPGGQDAPTNGSAVEIVAKPPAAVSELKMGTHFTVTLHKEDGQKLGFGLTRIGQTVTINEIKSEGAIVKYNNENPTKKVQLEDIINSVNGSSSSLDDIKTVVAKSSGTITMEMERPKIWEAALDVAAGGKLGVQFGEPEKVYVPVLGVDAEGAVPAFNAANPGNEITAGDFIIKTDELKKDGPKMLDYLKKKEGPSTTTCMVWRNLPG